MINETTMKQKLFKLLMMTTIILTGSTFIPAQDKTEFVKKLVGLTESSHPSILEKMMTENSVDTKKYEAEERRDYAGFVSDALNQNNQLNTEQKAFARKNLEKLVDRAAFEILVIQDRNINSIKWLDESLNQNYSAKFTVTELNSLIEYFGKDEGKNTLNYIATSPERQKSGEPNYSREEFLAYNDFVIKTPLGGKFFKIFVTDVQADLTAKFLAGNKQMRAEMNKFYENVSLNQLINQFVTENSEPTKTDKSNMVNALVETVIRLNNKRRGDFDSKHGKKFDDTVLRANNAEIFNEALKENKSLNADQMAFAKANYDKLHDILEAKKDALAKKIITDDVWEKDDLTMLFTNYLSIDEIKNISAFLQTSGGTDLMMNKKGNPESDNFSATITGSRFLMILNKEVLKLFNLKMNEAIDKYTEATFKITVPTEINKMINEFVASNYKK